MSDCKRNLKGRIRNIEQARGTGSVVFKFSDGSTRAFTFSRQDRLQILIANFELERSRRSGRNLEPRNPRATAIAKLVHRAVQVTPDSRFWHTAGLGMEEWAKREKESAVKKSDAVPDGPEMQGADV